MKQFVLMIIFMFVFQDSIAQNNLKSFDFIICIDEQIATTLSNPLIIAKCGTEERQIDVNYYAGNLSLSNDDYNYISSRQDIDLFLKFNYYQYSLNGKQKIYNYETIMRKGLFNQMFVILKIFNMDKKKYRKRFKTISKDKHYIINIDTSEGQILEI